jgi:hypothetical protein
VGKLGSQIPIDGTGDFNVSRPASNGFAGTRINENGLIENVDADVPRLDFTNGCGELLPEPQSVNLITFPRSFGNSYWTKTGARIEGDLSTEGAEKIVNGTFDTDTGWTKGARWTIAAGVARFDYISPSNLTAAIASLTIGNYYKMTFTISDCSTLARIYFPTEGIWRSLTNGTYTYYYYSATTSFAINAASDASHSAFSIDNVSVKEVTGFASPHVQYPTSGFKMVATAVNGVVQRITTGTNALPYSNGIWIKRVLGTGQVSLIGVNNVDVPITLTTEWVLYKSTVTSTSVNIYSGVKLATSGDEVMIAFAQLEQRASATSLMMPVTEGSTQQRNTDVVTVNPPTGTAQILEMINGVDVSRTVATPYTVSLNRIQKITMQ